mgnify:CR=1 FL=1
MKGGANFTHKPVQPDLNYFWAFGVFSGKHSLNWLGAIPEFSASSADKYLFLAPLVSLAEILFFDEHQDRVSKADYPNDFPNRLAGMLKFGASGVPESHEGQSECAE